MIRLLPIKSWPDHNRLLVLLGLGIALIIAISVFVAVIVVPTLIENAYRGESFPIFNRLISGQAVHPVEHYLMVWHRITYLGVLLAFVVSLTALLTEEKHVRAWARTRSFYLFAIVIGIHIVPLWIFTYFPSQDGPVHLNIANVLRHYYSHELPLFRE